MADLMQEIEDTRGRNCGHMCHTEGLNVWIESCPVCGCHNPDYDPQARMCNGCWAYPCECLDDASPHNGGS